MAGLTYDCGALLAGERNERRLWALHTRALQRQVLPVMPTVVLAQARAGLERMATRGAGGSPLPTSGPEAVTGEDQRAKLFP